MNISEFLRMQLDLQRGMKEANPDVDTGDPYLMSREELARFITWNHTALIVELGEAMDEVGWKPWASSRHINFAAFMKEMVDAWHFFLNMLLAAAALEESAGRVYPLELGEIFTEEYEVKNAKNLQRQIDSYDGVTGKCPYCHRELSDIPIEIRVVSEGLEFCCMDHAIFYQTERKVSMSQHDEERVQGLRKDIEQRSGAGTSASAEETTQAAKEKHRDAQQAAGFDVVGPRPNTGGEVVWTPPIGEKPIEQEIHEIDQRMTEWADSQAARSKNPHAFKMVMDAEKTGEPLFCFRARDFFSIQVLVHYANIVEQYGPDNPQFLEDIVDGIGEFKEWQKANTAVVRYPD